MCSIVFNIIFYNQRINWYIMKIKSNAEVFYYKFIIYIIYCSLNKYKNDYNFNSSLQPNIIINFIRSNF